MRGHVAYVAMLAALASAVPARTQSVAIPALSRRIDVGGRPAVATYHFDRNAIEDMVRAGDVLIAMTSSGNLLRVSADPLQLLDQQIIAGRATAITRDDMEHVLVGTYDGQILEIDSSSLASSAVTRVPGRVAWLDRRAGRLVVVVEPHTPPLIPGADADAWATARNKTTAQWTVVVDDAAGLRTFPFSSSPYPSGFHVDRRGTFWIAGDSGEFGGGLAWMDLATGKAERRELEYGVQGFLESDRRFEAYGGLNHLGSSTSFVASASTGYAITKWVASTFGPETVPEHPVAPIVDMQTDSEGRVWALSGGWLYRHDPRTSAWTRGPQVNGHRLLAAAGSPTLFVASSTDGISRVDGTNVATLSFRGQLPADALGLWDTPSGQAVLTMPPYGFQLASSWRLVGGAWAAQRFCPEAYDDRTTYAGLVVNSGWPVTSDARETVAVCDEPYPSRMERLLRSPSSGEWETLAEWADSPREHLISAPDGSWLRVDRFEGVLSRLVAGSWNVVGTAPEDHLNWFKPRALPEFVRVWHAAPDRALYHSVTTGQLLELTRQSDGRWRLGRANRAAIAYVWDASADGDDAILVTSPRGLFRYRPDTRVLTRIPSPAADRIVSMTRDTEGRLWSVGDRVHISTDEGQRWELVDVAADSTAEVVLVRPYFGVPGAVAVMTSNRGVVVITP